MCLFYRLLRMITATQKANCRMLKRSQIQTFSLGVSSSAPATALYLRCLCLPALHYKQFGCEPVSVGGSCCTLRCVLFLMHRHTDTEQTAYSISCLSLLLQSSCSEHVAMARAFIIGTCAGHTALVWLMCRLIHEVQRCTGCTAKDNVQDHTAPEGSVWLR